MVKINNLCTDSVLFAYMAPLPPRDQRHPWLRSVNQVHVLDFVKLTEGTRQTLAGRLRMVYTGDEAPVQGPQPPPPALDRTIAQRLSVLEDEVHRLRGVVGEQRGVLDSMTCDFSRFTTWTRCTRHRTGDASTSVAQQDEQQPDP
ncbi:hypothetical protein Tco_0024027 [Tanacetum coccineum]